MDDASAISSLPDDPALLKRMLAERTRQRDEQIIARTSIELQIQQVQNKNQQLENEKQLIESQKQAVEFKLLRVEVELLWYKKWY